MASTEGLVKGSCDEPVDDALLRGNDVVDVIEACAPGDIMADDAADGGRACVFVMPGC